MANDVATQKTASELLSEAAEELNGGNVGKILKFQKGKYFVGDDEIAVNSELIAHVTQLARGWVKFKNGELVDRRIGKVVDGFVAPQILLAAGNPRNRRADRVRLRERWRPRCHRCTG